MPNGEAIDLCEPTLVLSFGAPHSFSADPTNGAELVCAEVGLWGPRDGPLAHLLPSIMTVPTASVDRIASTLELLLDEAFAARSGRQAALDRLFEYLTIQILRHAIDNGLIKAGVLAGLADERLARALIAMHAEPRRAWRLEDLARTAGMSRSRFSRAFRTTLGVTPLDYLAGWRIARAQGLLRRGRTIKFAAAAVGYESPAAFSRAFARACGCSPRRWLAAADRRGSGERTHTS
jgi:transcriptional regulator GlxA family with amidase domain